jgi:hypothetical protein
MNENQTWYKNKIKQNDDDRNWKTNSIKKMIKKTNWNQKNEDQIWYKNQILKDEIKKNQEKKGFKTKWKAIKRMNIKFDIIMPFIFCKLTQFQGRGERKERWEEEKLVKAQP